MNLRFIGTYILGAASLVALPALHSNAQVRGAAQSNSASHVAAEVTKGKLNPADSKPGDTVVLKLKNDVKSNGEVVLKKGTTITGVVRSVKRGEAASAGKGDSKSRTQSMMDIEWLVPAAEGKAAQNLSIALQSLTQVNPIYQHEQESAAANDFGARTTAPSAGGGGGGLLGGTVAGVAGTTARASGQSNTALLSMPSVVAVDHETSSAIDGSLGSSSGQLFKVGRGQIVTANGSQQSVDIFSHLNNDTVITSASKDFEISTGAQTQLLIGVNKQ